MTEQYQKQDLQLHQVVKDSIYAMKILIGHQVVLDVHLMSE